MASIRKLKSGNYQVQIRLPALKPITKTFRTNKDAKAFARQVEGDIKLQQALGKPVIEQISFKQVCNLYMENYQGRDPSQLYRIDKWCKYFDNIAITDITEIMIDDMLIEHHPQ